MARRVPGRSLGPPRRSGRGEQFGQLLGGFLPLERFPRPAVQQPRDPIQLGLVVHGEVGPFREVLAQQPVGVLVAPALPRGVRIAAVDRLRGQIEDEVIDVVSGRFNKLERSVYVSSDTPRLDVAKARREPSGL
jgi:hypothetical protein